MPTDFWCSVLYNACFLLLCVVRSHARIALSLFVRNGCARILSFESLFSLSTSIHPFQSYYTWASHVTLPYSSLCLWARASACVRVVNIQQISCARSFYYNSRSNIEAESKRAGEKNRTDHTEWKCMSVCVSASMYSTEYIQYSHHKVRKVYKIDATDTNNVDRIILVLLYTRHRMLAIHTGTRLLRHVDRIKEKYRNRTDNQTTEAATPSAAQSAKTE